ncbi:putative non-specific serine/threonine protein kinase [Helianthus annuus]|nr:putative non-specific serine/threonine protein kinase [Helianthus annuus]
MESTTITKFAHLQIPLEDVQKATNNFHDDNIIGHGDFGRAYEGVLLRSDKLMKICCTKIRSPNLTWTQRLRICVGVAQSLSYLHSAEGRDYIVIHRFINSSTILLDENWEAKLSGLKFL